MLIYFLLLILDNQYLWYAANYFVRYQSHTYKYTNF